MSSKTTPEERAEAWLTKKGMWPEQMSSRINVGPARQSPTTKELFATCIREEVEPLEEEIKLIEIIGGLSFKPGRRPYELVAELAASRGDALARIDEAEAENAKLRALVQELVDAANKARNSGDAPFNSVNDLALYAGLKSAASQGFTPTNTTDK